MSREEITELTKSVPQEPTELEKLEAKITASSEYTDFLEEIIVEMAQVIYE